MKFQACGKFSCLALLSTSALLVIACGGSDSKHGQTHVAALDAGGGSIGGGTSSTGGSAITGGHANIGGSSNVGGTVASGGATGSAGASSTGGTPATGGTGSCTPTSSNLLQSPGFDGNNLSWSLVTNADASSATFVGSQNFADIGATGVVVTPLSGSFMAWLGGFNKASETLSQTVFVPLSATSVVFSFSYWIVSYENTNDPFDYLTAAIIDSSNTGLYTSSLTNANRYIAWRTVTSDDFGSTLAGKTVRIQFTDTTDTGLPTSFFIDSVSLLVAYCQ
jgi:xanthomonalisin